MAPRKTQQINQTQVDANEFGVGVRCGGWRLGLLVARNVEPSKGGRPSADKPTTGGELSKVSGSEFARMAGVSQQSVSYYYQAWELAAKANLVPHAETIKPGDEEICIDADAIEVDDDPKTQWGWFYSMARNPPKPKTPTPPKQDDSEVKTEINSDDSDDDDDSDVDDDFGIQSFTKQDAAEADSANQRNGLLELLESIRSVTNKIESVSTIHGDNDAIIGQIASAALDLNTTANALVAKSEINN